jgi:RNA polymerase sigma-70 factor (ECF subfamily)
MVVTRSAAMPIDTDDHRPTPHPVDASWQEMTTRLRSFIAARVGDPDLAADIAQDVLARSIAAGALQRADNPTAWLYRSARNAVIDHYRTRHTHQPLDHAAAERWPEPDAVDDRPNQATRDLAHCLRPFIEQLPDTYRDALERVDLAGQSQTAAAAELHITVSGMKSRVQRARHQLKQLLINCCAVHVDRHGAVTTYRPHNATCGCSNQERDATRHTPAS